MKKQMVFWGCLTIFFLSGLCWADSENQNEKIDDESSPPIMEQVVVTATRHEETTRKIPANVTVITSQEIAESGATNLTDLMKTRANLHVRELNGIGSQAIVDVRGLGGDNPYGKTLILLDGRRMNRPDMSSVNWLQVPLQLIERIEVVRGTNTVMYGDSAVAGVINIITKKGAMKTQTNLSAIVGENGSNVERAGIVGSKEKIYYAFNAEHQGNDGWRDRSSFNSMGAGVNIGYDLTDRFGISFNGSYNKTEFEIPGNLTKAEMDADRTQSQPARTWFPPAWFGWSASTPAHTDDESENEYINANMLFEGSLGDAGDLEVNFLWGNKDITADMPSGWVPGQYNQLDIDTLGITPRYILKATPFGFGNKVIAGLDFYHEKLSLDQFLDEQRNQKAWEAEVTKDSLGFYLRDEFSPTDQTILGIGYRTERAEYEAKKEEILGGGFGSAFDTKKKTHKEDAFDVSLTWLFGERSKIYSKYSKLYRFPFVDEQVSFYGLADGFNDTLDPEKGDSYEIGADFYPMDNLNIGFSVFRINLTDEIIWDNALNKNINLDETTHSGFELYVSYRIEELMDFWGKYDYHKAEFDNGQFKGKELPFAPNHLFSAGIDMTLPYDIHLCPEIIYVSDSYLGNDFDNSSEKLDGYTVYDLYIRYKPEKNRLKITAFFGAKNIFDEDYATIGYENDPNDGAAPANTFIPSAGREFIGGLSFEL